MCRYFFNKLIIVFFLLSLVITFGCKKEETDLAAALTLSTQTVELSVGEIQKVTIVTGNGEYACVSSNKQIVTTTVENETISIKGEGKGKAEVTVKDKKNRTKKIKISVLEEKEDNSFILSSDSVELKTGEVSQIEITGQGDYEVKSEDEKIVKADYENNLITLTGISEGATKVKVTNKATNRSKTISVKVLLLDALTIENGVLTQCDCKKIPENGQIVVPASVNKIGERAFFGCNNLISVVLPESITNIENEAFAFCIGLTEINWPANLTTIGEAAFYDTPRLSTLSFHNKLTSIGEKAFSGCSGVTTITLPNSILSIGNNAFERTSVSTITIPASLTSYGKGAFATCPLLSSINVEAGNTHFVSEGGVLFNANKTILYQYPIGKKDNSYQIPSTVVTIASYGFCESENLTSITIPNSVTKIEDYSFMKLNMSTIELPSNLTHIGEHCFSFSNLVSIVIPNNVTYLGPNAFAVCQNLEEITLSEKITTIQGFTFSTCEKLTSVKGWDNITKIGKSAFNGCGFVQLTLPKKLTHIEEHAFANCYAVTLLEFGENVTNIDQWAFQYLWGLTEITSKMPTPPTISANVFEQAGDETIEAGGKVTLKVPKNRKTAYSTADYWKDFDIVEEE